PAPGSRATTTRPSWGATIRIRATRRESAGMRFRELTTVPRPGTIPASIRVRYAGSEVLGLDGRATTGGLAAIRPDRPVPPALGEAGPGGRRPSRPGDSDPLGLGAIGSRPGGKRPA